jgi:hypothetical protein
MPEAPTKTPQNLNALDEFSALTTMLTLVTAINSGGRQVLQSDKSKLPEMPTTLKKPQSESILDALATLLVREVEIVAVTAFTSVEQSPADPSQPQTIADTLDILAIWESESPHEDDSSFSDPKFNPDFTALPNPNSLSPFEDVPSNAQYTILKEGKSYWPDVEKNPWSQVVPL